MVITDRIRYIGVTDRNIRLFEGLYEIERGMSYNSYVIFDEKTVVMDSVEGEFVDEWMENLQSVLKGKTPDYLVVQHMEPDHSAGIFRFAQQYPSVKIVASDKAFVIMRQMFGTGFEDRRMVVKDNDRLPIGKGELVFFSAPMIHWPEVIMTYESTSNTFFSADAFGKFGAWDAQEEWAAEASRYYFGIVGKYGRQVQNLLKKVSHLQIDAICPLHGPVLTENLSYYLGLYDKWSSYTPELDGVLIAYTSVYGNTERAAEKLAELLKRKGRKVQMCNLSVGDVSGAISDAFRYSRLVLATTTYNSGIFPTMENFLRGLLGRNFQNRTVGLIENGSWAPFAAQALRKLLQDVPGISFEETVVTVRSALSQESEAQLEMLAQEMSK